MKLPGARSVTLRLTLLFASASGAVLMVLGLAVGHLVERHFAELDTEMLSGKLELARHVLGQVHTAADLQALAPRVEAAFVGDHELSLRIRATDDTILYASPDADFPRVSTEPAGVAGLVHAADGRELRVLTGSAPLGMQVPPVLVELATDLVHHQHFMSSFRAALWATVGLAAFVTGLMGWAVARRGLAPLRAITSDAARLTAERLDWRVPVDSVPQELAEVAVALNQMLARLERSFQRLSDFSSDLAHELRTPLSNLLTQTQVTLSQPRSTAEYRDILASNAEEYERLSRTISDMLFLAKAENDLMVPQLELVDLREEVDAMLEFYGNLAEEKSVEVSVSGQASVAGDRLMLRRAIGNLLSNACRHTPVSGAISVVLSSVPGGGTTITVRNTGETIDAQHLPHLFDRFYRADAARRRDAEGAGLGLAITRSIVRAHGGTASARSSDGVTEFELMLPA
ncbi:heavy metal sensor histidine kinase [Massilia sp.]|uniref:heavy metal sensor histidine kinase n=1 Tax=Massilia sp. TaxID=1882437 RepID=UPI0028B0BFA3|nr:heavy metal sensor histidine kinase [Massilia sp.]